MKVTFKRDRSETTTDTFVWKSCDFDSWIDRAAVRLKIQEKLPNAYVGEYNDTVAVILSTEEDDAEFVMLASAGAFDL